MSTKGDKSSGREGERKINALFTNLQSLTGSGDACGEAEFLSFALRRIKRSSGLCMRNVMCMLLDYSLRTHSDFAPQYDRLKREYESLCGIRGTGSASASDVESVPVAGENVSR